MPWEDGFTFKAAAYVAPLKPRRPDTARRASRPRPPHRPHPRRLLRDTTCRHRRLPLDDAAFARRVFLDLIGLLPPPEELDAFLKDATADKRTRLVRSCSADQRAYADHWLTFWNDLLRNDYPGTGYIDGGRKQITAWLYQSLLDNKPYDQFVRELISPTPDVGGLHQRHQVARQRQRQPGAASCSSRRTSRRCSSA